MLPPSGSRAATPTRVASLDYGLAETMLAIGTVPVAVAAAADWKTWVVEPPLPSSVQDLGAGQEPNFERLAALRPDLILTTDYVAMVEPALARIAPVERLTLFAAGVPPMARARDVMRTLGARLDRADAARDALARFDAEMDAIAARLAGRRRQPLLLATFMDPRHVRVYGTASLYGNVLSRLGLANAWPAEVNYWGFSTVGIEALGDRPDARLVAIEPVPPDVWPVLARSPLWTALPFVRAGAISTIAPALMFGALPSALRFARLLAADLEGGSAA